jgi:hypothetical protein
MDDLKRKQTELQRNLEIMLQFQQAQRQPQEVQQNPLQRDNEIRHQKHRFEQKPSDDKPIVDKITVYRNILD